jgi:hypothetical protein
LFDDRDAVAVRDSQVAMVGLGDTNAEQLQCSTKMSRMSLE